MKSAERQKRERPRKQPLRIPGKPGASIEAAGSPAFIPRAGLFPARPLCPFFPQTLSSTAGREAFFSGPPNIFFYFTFL